MNFSELVIGSLYRYEMEIAQGEFQGIKIEQIVKYLGEDSTNVLFEVYEDLTPHISSVYREHNKMDIGVGSVIRTGRPAISHYFKQL